MIPPRWDQPFLGFHKILPLKANGEHLSRVPARSLVMPGIVLTLREEHVSVYLGRVAKHRLGMLSSFGTLANCLDESLTPTRNTCFLGFLGVDSAWRWQLSVTHQLSAAKHDLLPALPAPALSPAAPRGCATLTGSRRPDLGRNRHLRLTSRCSFANSSCARSSGHKLRVN